MTKTNATQMTFFETLEAVGTPAAAPVFIPPVERPAPTVEQRPPAPAPPPPPEAAGTPTPGAILDEFAPHRRPDIPHPPGWLLAALTGAPDIYGLLAAGPDESLHWLRTYAMRWLLVGDAGRVPPQHWWDWWAGVDLGNLVGGANSLLRLLEMEQWYIEKIGLYGEDGYLSHGLTPLCLLARHGCPPPKQGRDKVKYARAVSEWEVELAHRFVGLARVAKRWQYWLRWLAIGDYPPGRGEDRTQNELARIPQLEFPEYQHNGPTNSHPEERLRHKVRKNIEDTLDVLYRNSSSGDVHVALMEYVLHAMGKKVWQRSSELYDKIAAVFDIVGFVAFPTDWLGEILAEEQRGKYNAFYPTPMQIVSMMTRMVFIDREGTADAAEAISGERYCRDASGKVISAHDPCGGTMRMPLYLSNYVLDLSYMDVWHTAWIIALAYACCWVPWMILPMGSVSLEPESSPPDPSHSA